MQTNGRTRWLALTVLCLGTLMIVLDTTIVNVALPSIRVDLGFSSTSLAWVVNAYLLTFGGFLLLGGRLGDLFGNRRLFVAGIALFTLASLCCGLAGSQGLLVTARAIQGSGAAIVSAVGLSLMMSLFTEPGERAKAMGLFGFVASGGGSIGVLLGGILTSALNWHWIFLVNVPIGIAVVTLAMRLLPGRNHRTAHVRLDIAGAITITASLMLAVFAIVNGNQAGWASGQTLGGLGAAIVLLGVFIVVEFEGRASAGSTGAVPAAHYRGSQCHRRALGGRHVRVVLPVGAISPARAGLYRNTAFMMGGALGLAVLASLAAARPRTSAPSPLRWRRSSAGTRLRSLPVPPAAGAAAIGAGLLRFDVPAVIDSAQEDSERLVA